jgi:hypothetical protein
MENRKEKRKKEKRKQEKRIKPSRGLILASGPLTPPARPSGSPQPSSLRCARSR